MEDLSFETNIILAGMIAKVYASLDYYSPIQGWGSAVQLRDFEIGNNHYTVGPMRQKIDDVMCQGVGITERPNKYGVGGVDRTWFIPLESLRNINLLVKGIEVK